MKDHEAGDRLSRVGAVDAEDLVQGAASRPQAAVLVPGPRQAVGREHAAPRDELPDRLDLPGGEAGEGGQEEQARPLPGEQLSGGDLLVGEEAVLEAQVLDGGLHGVHGPGQAEELVGQDRRLGVGEADAVIEPLRAEEQPADAAPDRPVLGPGVA